MLGQSELPGAAWYPDPYGASTLRWWDGAQWTDAVHPPLNAPSPAPAPAVAQTPSEFPTWQATPQPTAPVAAQPTAEQQSAPVVSEIVTTQATVSASSAPQAQVSAGSAPQAPATAPVVANYTNPIATSPHSTGAHSAGPLTAPPLATGPLSTGPLSTGPVSTGPVASPPATPLGLRAAAATLEEDTGTGKYEWSRESRAFDTFPGSAAPVRISPRALVTADVVTGTSSSWTIVFMPLLAIISIVAVMLVIASVPALQVTGFPSELLLASIAVAFYLVTVLFALADNRRLYSNGMDRPPHWAWSLVTAPVYLVARLVAVKRETGRTKLGQLIVHVLLLAGGVFLALNFTEMVWPYLVSLMAGL